MNWHAIPQALQDAHVELETTKLLWQSTEEQVALLIDAAIRRIAEENPEFYEENEETILQRDRTDHSMRRIARTTAILQGWAIFEHAACWSADEWRRRGKPIGTKRQGENVSAWAIRELKIGWNLGNSRLHADFLDWMDTLCRLRNILIHTNGQYDALKAPEQERVNQWVASKKGVLLNECRIDLTEHFVKTALDVFSLAVGSLSMAWGDQHKGI